MDLPVHIATGALIGNIALYADSKFRQQPPSTWHRVELGTACFLLGVLSHLFEDAVPHYDWLFYVRLFHPLPYWWLIPQAIGSLLVLLIVFHVARDHRIITIVAIIGGIYPDLEKLAYLDFHLPQSLVIFRKHSCYLSQWTPWELEHKTFLIVFEVFLLIALLVGNAWVALKRRNLQNFITQIFEIFAH